MARLFSFLFVVVAFVRGAFAAGLVVPQDGIALGEVQPGEAVAAEVVVSNDAGRVISVSRVKACCGGEATMEPMSVPAKGEAKLTLRMKAQIPGEIAKAVTLYCDDPHRPIVEIPVTGRVVETAEVKMMAGEVDGLRIYGTPWIPYINGLPSLKPRWRPRTPPWTPSPRRRRRWTGGSPISNDSWRRSAKHTRRRCVSESACRASAGGFKANCARPPRTPLWPLRRRPRQLPKPSRRSPHGGFWRRMAR